MYQNVVPKWLTSDFPWGTDCLSITQQRYTRKKGNRFFSVPSFSLFNTSALHRHFEAAIQGFFQRFTIHFTNSVLFLFWPLLCSVIISVAHFRHFLIFSADSFQDPPRAIPYPNRSLSCVMHITYFSVCVSAFLQTCLPPCYLPVHYIFSSTCS